MQSGRASGHMEFGIACASLPEMPGVAIYKGLSNGTWPKMLPRRHSASSAMACIPLGTVQNWYARSL